MREMPPRAHFTPTQCIKNNVSERWVIHFSPRCAYFATARHWEREFGRKIKEDARPMLILAPMHPVMTVYDLDSTTGPLPEELEDFRAS